MNQLPTDQSIAEIAGQKKEKAGRKIISEEIISAREKCFKETGNAVNAEQLLPNCPSNHQEILRFFAENASRKKEQNDNRFEINKNPAGIRGIFISIDPAPISNQTTMIILSGGEAALRL